VQKRQVGEIARWIDLSMEAGTNPVTCERLQGPHSQESCPTDVFPRAIAARSSLGHMNDLGVSDLPPGLESLARALCAWVRQGNSASLERL